MRLRLYFIYIAVVGFFSLAAVNVYAQEDALHIWSTTVINKSLGKENKWNVGVLSEYRHQFHEGLSKTNQYFVRPSFSYKVLPWLRLQYQMDFAATASSGFNMRFIPEVTFTHKTGDFTLAYRQRVMTTWKVKAGENFSVLRSRFRVDYNVPKTPLSLYFAAEPYWCEFSREDFRWFQKIRWYAGFSVRLTENLSIVPQYNCQAYHNHKGKYDRRTYDDHVVYITFMVKL